MRFSKARSRTRRRNGSLRVKLLVTSSESSRGRNYRAVPALFTNLNPNHILFMLPEAPTFSLPPVPKQKMNESLKTDSHTNQMSRRDKLLARIRKHKSGENQPVLTIDTKKKFDFTSLSASAKNISRSRIFKSSFGSLHSGSDFMDYKLHSSPTEDGSPKVIRLKRIPEHQRKGSVLIKIRNRLSHPTRDSLRSNQIPKPKPLHLSPKK